MAFESFSQFLQMGKHGFYVWLSYGFFLICLLAITIPLFIENRRLKKEFKKEGLRYDS